MRVGIFFAMSQRVMTIPLRRSEAYLPGQVGLRRWTRGFEWGHFGGEAEVREYASTLVNFAGTSSVGPLGAESNALGSFIWVEEVPLSSRMMPGSGWVSVVVVSG